GCGGEEFAASIDGHGADRALVVAAMVRRSVFVLAAKLPSIPLGVADEFCRGAKGEAVVSGEAFRALADEHHVRAVLQHGTRKSDWVADSLQSSDGPSTQRRAVHHDRVALHAAVEIQMRAKPRVEYGLVFKDNNSSLHGVERGTAPRKNRPSRFKAVAAPGIASLNGFIGNIPGAAMHNKRRFHRDENGKASRVCPERGSAAVFIP